jgi:uncharacterized protein (TIGR02246 family)
MTRLFASAAALAALSFFQTASAQSGCQLTSESQVADLFNRWNDSLATGSAGEVVKNYAENAIFLSTYSDKPRLTQQERYEYYTDILKRHPQLKVEQRVIHIGCNMANDTGLYMITFNGKEKVPGRYSISYQYIDGTWLIVAQHTALMPEKR